MKYIKQMMSYEVKFTVLSNLGRLKTNFACQRAAPAAEEESAIIAQGRERSGGGGGNGCFLRRREGNRKRLPPSPGPLGPLLRDILYRSLPRWKDGRTDGRRNEKPTRSLSCVNRRDDKTDSAEEEEESME